MIPAPSALARRSAKVDELRPDQAQVDDGPAPALGGPANHGPRSWSAVKEGRETPYPGPDSDPFGSNCSTNARRSHRPRPRRARTGLEARPTSYALNAPDRAPARELRTRRLRPRKHPLRLPLLPTPRCLPARESWAAPPVLDSPSGHRVVELVRETTVLRSAPRPFCCHPERPSSNANRQMLLWMLDKISRDIGQTEPYARPDDPSGSQKTTPFSAKPSGDTRIRGVFRASLTSSPSKLSYAPKVRRSLRRIPGSGAFRRSPSPCGRTPRAPRRSRFPHAACPDRRGGWLRPSFRSRTGWSRKCYGTLHPASSHRIDFG